VPLNIWLIAGIALALIGFPAVSLAVACWSQLRGRSNSDRPRELDTSVPGRTIPGGEN
jgi:hypothetical protein